MRRLLVGGVAAAVVVLGAARGAEAKLVSLYASGQGGLQNRGNTGLQGGFEVGAHVLLLDGYVSYMAFGSGESISRGILGLRGGLELHDRLRLSVRGGVGAIREDRAVTLPNGQTGVARTGGVARAGGLVELRILPLIWVGLGFDAEEFAFLSSNPGEAGHGSDVLGTLKLTFELGI